MLQADVSTLQSESLRSDSMCQVHLTGGHGPRGRIQVQGETAGICFYEFHRTEMFLLSSVCVQNGSLKRVPGAQSLGCKI